MKWITGITGLVDRKHKNRKGYRRIGKNGKPGKTIYKTIGKTYDKKYYERYFLHNGMRRFFYHGNVEIVGKKFPIAPDDVFYRNKR